MTRKLERVLLYLLNSLHETVLVPFTKALDLLDKFLVLIALHGNGECEATHH